jgi:ribonuclease HII
VVAAACIMPEDLVIDAINDSKQMTEEDREEVGTSK